MTSFSCDCGSTLFFGSRRCLTCGMSVGFDPQSGKMRRLTALCGLKACGNGVRHDVCNWLLSERSAQSLCLACSMNQLVPDLSEERNKVLWSKAEAAKRRLIFTLLRLDIAPPSKKEQPLFGLSFVIVSTVLNPLVTTGHLNGVITVNLEEADDTYRQINRQQLGENSRTLLGHFRHESAHYFWGRFLSNLDWNDSQRVAFRGRFGNEWLDYGSALTSHYRDGPPTDWRNHHISAYASSHPWEDWAETWAHYLQMIDGLETCGAMGVDTGNIVLNLVIMPPESGFLPPNLPQSPHENAVFLTMLQRWICLSTVLNEIADSLGEAPLYPFVISVPVAQKLRLAHFFAAIWREKNFDGTASGSP